MDMDMDTSGGERGGGGAAQGGGNVGIIVGDGGGGYWAPTSSTYHYPHASLHHHHQHQHAYPPPPHFPLPTALPQQPTYITAYLPLNPFYPGLKRLHASPPMYVRVDLPIYPPIYSPDLLFYIR